MPFPLVRLVPILLGVSTAAAQTSPTGWIDSVQTSNSKVVVVGGMNDVRITVRSGARTIAVVVPTSTAFSFTTSAFAIWEHPPPRRFGTRDSSYVSRDSLRFAYSRTDAGDSVHVAIGGRDGIAIETTRDYGGRILSVISRAARFASSSRVAQTSATQPGDQAYFEFQTTTKVTRPSILRCF